jgi:hypothetical protein
MALTEETVILDVNGVGYEAYCSGEAFRKTTVGEVAELYTYLQVKEDGVTLFGFANPKEKELFLKRESDHAPLPCVLTRDIPIVQTVNCFLYASGLQYMILGIITDWARNVLTKIWISFRGLRATAKNGQDLKRPLSEK